MLANTDSFQIDLYLEINRIVLFRFSRIIGKTARSQDIFYSVSVQIQKNFAKTKWKVSACCFPAFVRISSLVTCSL